MVICTNPGEPPVLRGYMAAKPFCEGVLPGFCADAVSRKGGRGNTETGPERSLNGTGSSPADLSRRCARRRIGPSATSTGSGSAISRSAPRATSTPRARSRRSERRTEGRAEVAPRPRGEGTPGHYQYSLVATHSAAKHTQRTTCPKPTRMQWPRGECKKPGQAARRKAAVRATSA